MGNTWQLKISKLCHLGDDLPYGQYGTFSFQKESVISQYAILTYILDAAIFHVFHINTCRWDIQHSSVSRKIQKKMYLYMYMNILGFCCEKLHANRRVNENKYALKKVNYFKEKTLVIITWSKKIQPRCVVSTCPFLTKVLLSLFLLTVGERYIIFICMVIISLNILPHYNLKMYP